MKNATIDKLRREYDRQVTAQHQATVGQGFANWLYAERDACRTIRGDLHWSVEISQHHTKNGNPYELRWDVEPDELEDHKAAAAADYSEYYEDEDDQ